jgi:hypothetical protein
MVTTRIACDFIHFRLNGSINKTTVVFIEWIAPMAFG